MNQTLTSKTHARGAGRVYTGLAISGIALFWLAKKVGWLGVGSGGFFWPLLAIGIGLAMVVSGRRHCHTTECRAARQPNGFGA
jgi:hypothetical protein